MRQSSYKKPAFLPSDTLLANSSLGGTLTLRLERRSREESMQRVEEKKHCG
jgi:hypothetical protein